MLPWWSRVEERALYVGIHTILAPRSEAASTAAALRPPTAAFSATAPCTLSPGYIRERMSARGAVG